MKIGQNWWICNERDQKISDGVRVLHEKFYPNPAPVKKATCYNPSVKTDWFADCRYCERYCGSTPCRQTVALCCFSIVLSKCQFFPGHVWLCRWAFILCNFFRCERITSITSIQGLILFLLSFLLKNAALQDQLSKNRTCSSSVWGDFLSTARMCQPIIAHRGSAVRVELPMPNSSDFIMSPSAGCCWL